MANRERGVYYQANQWSNWELTQDLMNKIGQDSPYEPDINLPSKALNRRVVPIQEEEVRYDLYYQFPLAIAILFLIFHLISPDTRRL